MVLGFGIPLHKIRDMGSRDLGFATPVPADGGDGGRDAPTAESGVMLAHLAVDHHELVRRTIGHLPVEKFHSRTEAFGRLHFGFTK